MSESPSPLLRVEALTKEYGEEVITRALAGVDLSLDQGEFAALMGPSGSGKSTLLNLIGLLDRPTGGRVWLKGRDTGLMDEQELTAYRGKTLGFIFQAHLLLPAFTALENVMLPSWASAGYPSAELRASAEGLLAEVGLADKARSRVTELSGGQQQRVAITRALAHSPSLVLADEPTGNLDTEASQGVFDLMRGLNRARSTTFLVVTHDARIADQCDRIIEIVDGRIRGDRRK